MRTSGGDAATGDGAAAVHAAYAALGRGDLLTFTSHLDDQVLWHQPQGFGPPFGGAHRGPVAIMQNVVRGWTDAWHGVSFSPATFLAGDNHVVALGATSYHGPGGTVGRTQFAHVWLLSDNRAVEVHVFEDTAIAALHRRVPSTGALA